MTDLESTLPKNSSGYEKIDGSSGFSKRQRYCFYAVAVAVTIAVIVGVAAVAGASMYPPVDAAASSGGLKSSDVRTCSLKSGTIKIISSGDSRAFELYVPASAPTSRATLSIIWHGIASNPADIETKMAFKPAADKDGFILAYPVGVGLPKCFNGAGCCATQAIGSPKDDVQFGKDVISFLEDKGCIHPDNVFSTGFSNGAFMTHRMGCQSGLRPDGKPWIKAIAPHSGLMGLARDPDSGCSPGRTVPVLSFHGDDDPTVGYDGKGLLGAGPWRSFVDTMGVWAANNGCKNLVSTQSSASTVCVEDAACHVKYCTVSGGLGHNWSGAPAERVTRPADLDATTMIHAFFSSFVVV